MKLWKWENRCRQLGKHCNNFRISQVYIHPCCVVPFWDLFIFVGCMYNTLLLWVLCRSSVHFSSRILLYIFNNLLNMYFCVVHSPIHPIPNVSLNSDAVYYYGKDSSIPIYQGGLVWRIYIYMCVQSRSRYI